MPRTPHTPWLAIACLLATLLATPVSLAADRPAVVVTQGGEQKFKVALQEFAGGPGADTYRDQLAGALEFSGVFRMIDSKAFLGDVKTPGLGAHREVVCSDWTQIGADAFVEGALKTEGQDFVAEFRVWDLAGCQRRLRKRYRQLATANTGVLARRMADDIVEAFTGTRGVSSTELAFVSRRGGNPEIFVMDADGGNQRAATANRSINNFPGWSPSGDAIVYTSYRSDDRPLLYLSTRGRGRPGRLFTKLGKLPQYRGVFSPVGRELAIVMSPSGSTELYRVGADGSGLRRLTKNRAIDISPSWSPSGDRLAFVSDRSGSPQIYIMDADGSGARRLTYDGNYNTSPAWSPDGRWIAYQGRVGGQFDIWVIDPEGTVNLPLISHPRDDEAPVWSPDSRKLAFHSTRRGSADVYVADSSGANVRRLTTSRGDDTSPAWGPFPQ
jgi:TolB protein